MKDKIFKFVKNIAIFGMIYGALFFMVNHEPQFAKFGIGWKLLTFVSVILFMARNKILMIGKPLIIIFGFFPATSIGVTKFLANNNIQVHSVVKWIIVATLVSGLIAAYKFGFKLLNEIGYRTFSFIWDSIANSTSFVWNKLFGRKKVAVNIDLTIEQIDNFGDKNAKDYNHQKGYAFEDYIANLYRAAGYEAHTTTELRHLGLLPPSIQKRGGSGEQGVDVVVKYPLKNGGTHILIIRCKHYTNKVENNAVQQIHSAMNLYKGDQACVITNNYFTASAIEQGKFNNVLLVDRDGLQEMIKKVVTKVQNESKNSKKEVKPKINKEYEDFKNNPYIQEIDKEEKQTTYTQYQNDMNKLSLDNVATIPQKVKAHPNDAFWQKMKKGA